MEKILIISNYYPPEKGAAANRIEQLAFKLHQNNYAVCVVCPMANYPKGEIFEDYKNKFFIKEKIQNILVSRLWIYPSVSKNFLTRSLSVLSFSGLLFLYLLFIKTPKKVIVQSPPLLLSFISVLILKIKRKKIILNVSDLWPTAAIELGVMKPKSVSHRIALMMEKFIYRHSENILCQSNEIIAHIDATLTTKSCFLYRNYPDHQIQNFFENSIEHKKTKLFYAGLLGVAQGVLELCEKINSNNLGIEFHIFGDGAEKLEIKKYIENNPKKNIVFHGMLERQDLIVQLQDFDVAIVPLKTRIFGSVPSKIFEYTALGIPVLYFGGGEGEQIVAKFGLGWVVPVEDFDALNETIKNIANIDQNEIQNLKKHVFEQSKNHFNLDFQIKTLLNQSVF